MSNSTSTSTNLNVQFYDDEKYDNICDTILYYNKIYIQNYQNELNMIPNNLDKQSDTKIIELQNSNETKKFNRYYFRNILIKEYKGSIKYKYNHDWNKSLFIYLNIIPLSTLKYDDYINFYDGNNFY